MEMMTNETASRAIYSQNLATKRPLISRTIKAGSTV